MSALPQPVPPATLEQPPAPACISSPEFDLLLACCAEVSKDVSKDERDRRIGELLGHALDWKRLLQLAEHHGVIPQLYRRLSAAADLAPSPLAALRQHYEANARQTLWLTRELLRILGHLQSRGIEALPYKGPALAEMLYGNVALRQFSDLDVLIRATDFARAKAAVIELGYGPGIELTLREERAYLASGYECTFDSPHGRNLLEMQWQILPKFYSVDFDVDGFFGRAAVVSVGERSLRTLCAEDLMLVLCAHATKHVWIQLSWLCDIAELARSPQLDWDAVQQQAGRLGVERIVAVTFFLAHKLLGTPLPAPVQAQLRTDCAVEALASRVLPIITQSAEYNTEAAPYFRLMMDLRERWPDRVRFLWRLIFTPSVGEWSAVKLPGPLFPLYRVVRIFRLMGRMRTS